MTRIWALALSLLVLASVDAAADGPPPPPWTAGLDMRGMESEIKARIDDGLAQRKLDAARAMALRAQMATLEGQEQAYRAARHWPDGEWDRVSRDLLAIAAALPDIPPLHPPEAPPSGLAWIPAAGTTPLDLTGYRLSFDDEFDRLDIAPDGGSARWYAPVHTDFGEAHFQPPGPLSPFRLLRNGPLGVAGSALAISASRSADGWRAGLIQTLDSRGRGFAQQYGYFEMRAKLPKGQATWPGFWLLTRNNLVDHSVPHGEIDILEQYGSSPDKIHSSVHLWPATDRNAGGLVKHWYKSEKIAVGDMSSAYHRYGVMLTPQWVITYYDGMETSRFPMLEQYKTPVYMLVNLTMHEKGLAEATSPSTMLIDYVRAYTRG